MVVEQRRCRSCSWWMVRTGCVCPELLSPKTVAFIPPKAEIYRKTTCPYFQHRTETLSRDDLDEIDRLAHYEAQRDAWRKEASDVR